MGRAIGLFLTGAVFLSVPIMNALFHGSCPWKGVILIEQRGAGNPHIDGLEGVFPEGV